ncbi:hypothetical protein DMC64_36935 [Amycolatopsis sp. WAC 04197]|uniref:hypothetical protein n=1 Tax=Amycolatopsis sp. WAC 04197 TaxID=2203199 RepID=UPI000F793EE7|nr:hypothetical protein [Amycolatopsis sp. WAC 04197]RSN39910.1 hypothetical protein DMC64_36935 [Amycolatopsis sp. WAC 04197]
MNNLPERSGRPHFVGRCRVPKRPPDRGALIGSLRKSPLAPAVFITGIEHRAAAAIVHAVLPSVVHTRRSIHWSLDEHLFIDEAANTGVRVLTHWDEHLQRPRMEVAEIGDRLLWQRIVILFADWERAGRPVPEETLPSA